MQIVYLDPMHPIYFPLISPHPLYFSLLAHSLALVNIRCISVLLLLCAWYRTIYWSMGGSGGL